MEKKEITSVFSKIAYYCFYVGVIIETLLVLIDKSAYTNPIEGQIFRLTFLLFLIKVCLTRYNWREYVVIALFLGLGAISYLVTGRNEIIRFVMFIAACKDMDMSRCLKLVFWLTLTGCAVIILLSLTGIYGTVSLTQDYGRGSVETRYTLGMGHPNALQCMVWALTTLGLYLYGEKLKWYWYVAILAVNVGFFLLTDSKTSLLVAVMGIGYCFLFKYLKTEKGRRRLTYLGIGTVFGCIAASVLIAAQAYRIYDYVWHYEWSKPTQLLVYLDRLLTGRIHSLVGTTGWQGTIQTWKLFSSPENDYYFDMGWIRLFYWYGVIPAVIIAAVLLIVLVYCMKQKKYMAIVMLVSFSVYTFMEAHAVSQYLGRNYSLFIMGVLWPGMLMKYNWRKKL